VTSSRSIGWGAALALVTVTVGCSTDGVVVIHNQSNTDFVGAINDRGIALGGAESIELSVKIGTRVLFFGGGEKDVIFEGESCTRTPFSETVTVEQGEEIDVFIQPDAVCLVYRNDSAWNVEAAYRRTAGTSDWGESEIGGTLFAAEAEFQRISPGSYDFLMVDECGDSTTVLDRTLVAGQRIDVAHTGAKDGGCGG